MVVDQIREVQSGHRVLRLIHVIAELAGVNASQNDHHGDQQHSREQNGGTAIPFSCLRRRRSLRHRLLVEGADIRQE